MGTQRERLAQRLERGDYWIRTLLDHWVKRSRRTTRQMEAIAAWGLGERGRLSHALISRIINGKNGASLPSLLAMEALNRGIWLWHAKGHDAAMAELGPPSSWDVKPEWLDEAIWLPVPDQQEHPLDLADLCEVAAGRLELPYLGSRLLPPTSQRQVAEQLPRLLDQAIIAAGLSPMAGVRRLLEAYPVQDEHRRDRFRSVILGELMLTRDELQDELLAIAEAVAVTRGLPPGSYGPAQLLAELLALSQE